jgi:hypothetical protein
MKTHGGVDVGGERSVSRPCRFTPSERASGTHWIGGWVSPGGGLDDVENREFLILPGLELWPLSRPVHSQSLSRLMSWSICSVRDVSEIVRLKICVRAHHISSELSDKVSGVLKLEPAECSLTTWFNYGAARVRGVVYKVNCISHLSPFNSLKVANVCYRVQIIIILP